jgi:phosphoglycolate phosphatase
MAQMCKNIIFDLDGTLTNPLEGIYNSLCYALRELNYRDIPKSLPIEFIGPPLQQSFKTIYDFNEKKVDLAVCYFREYYGTKGLYENYPYPGIDELLEELAMQGKKLYVATSKLEKYAREILLHFGFDNYIVDIQGADYAGNHSKSDLIEALITKHSLQKDETIMVGDTLFDIEGAHEAGIKCLAVGYGFSSKEMLEVAKPDYYVEDVESLMEMLLL